jgi:outer membrane protein
MISASMRLLAAVTLISGCAWAQETDRVEVISLQRAHELALLNAPRVTVAQLSALVALDQVALARVAYLPSVTGEVTSARATSDNTRIAAGAINAPSVFDRESAGVVVNQLITDFGRTSSLIDAAQMHAWAEGKHSQALIEQVLLDVDILYYRTLQSQARLTVAQQTITTRQDVENRIEALTAQHLKSELDLGFAKVNLEEGRMLEAQTRNELTINQLTLAAVLGYDTARPFRLVDQAVVAPAKADTQHLVDLAIVNNPQIAQLRLEVASLRRQYDASEDLDYPTLSAVGVAGIIKNHDPRLASSYAAAALNLSIPLFTGMNNSTLQHQADIRLDMARAAVHVAEEELSKDVRVALSNRDYLYARLTMVQQLLEQASRTFDLARARFDLGLASIVDLNQADLAKTDAAMTRTLAQQEYLIEQAILANDIGPIDPTIALPRRGQSADEAMQQHP